MDSDGDGIPDHLDDDDDGDGIPDHLEGIHFEQPWISLISEVSSC